MNVEHLIVVSTLCVAVSAFAAPFGDGERVVFWGDSITHGGLYTKMLADFYFIVYTPRH